MVRFCFVAAVVSLIGCGAVSRRGGSTDATGGTTSVAGSAGQAGTGAVGEDLCRTLGSSPPEVPMRLLYDFERENVLEQLGAPAAELPSGPRKSMFVDDTPFSVGAHFVEQAFLWAERMASALSQDGPRLSQLIGCDVTVEGEEACRDALNQFVIRRLFRGLASAETSAELDEVFDNGVELGGSYAGGVRAVLEVALQSPELHYRFEFGRPAPEKGPGWAQATDHEMASRLSFLFWDSGPDDELLAAADRGELHDAQVLEAQARRLLADERARRPVRRFYRDLLGVSDVYELPSASFPDFHAGIGRWVQQQHDAFVDDATFGPQGDFRALFAPVTWLNAPLAEFLGLPGPSGEAFEPVALDAERYVGLLTLPAWLHRPGSSFTHPTARGYHISRGLLCNDIPPEPPGLPGFDVPPPEPGPLTMRQRLEAHSNDAICAACHQMMDPLGLAFEHFDAAGRYRETEDGLPIDTYGEIMVTDAAGPFDGPVQLVGRIVQSRDSRSCFVQNWASFAYGRRTAEGNACAVDTLARRFAESNEKVGELLVALTQTDPFRYLEQVEP